MSKVKITLKKSVIGAQKKQLQTVEALGLKKVNDSVEKADTPAVRGMIDKVSHLVTVEEL
ncbi:large subunit ribosomal protein L30 [Cerasibacillus quisquiliarum]|uniref:Large ribosomal subunit protein uL30 n=1 Tax=Cerasibacillus quisquiliarum TaxID=227865 RepID=A0A511V425_9BACI|nr:50S ribosomal protein L30 [Cerasibacillus quisquiliarum]MBB5147177.1 large subunit ribosomal protein L30 [Cerasibacillus quisquiliarum]GEN31992.1 50S ribosomal protein L30 [Cerasibacillus quisquiliarum]